VIKRLPDNIDALAKRAVSCARWDWRYGMLALIPPAHSGATGYFLRVVDETDRRDCRMDNALPALDDPATAGCLLKLVREVWGSGVYLLPDGGWYVKGARLKDGATVNLGVVADSEAEALVAALEVAE
jgi:hypothetical protein